MIKLSNILKEQDTDFDKERTEDPTSKPQDKFNVLFIGDGDTHSKFSYAHDLLNAGVVVGNIVSTADGDITKMLSLLQTHVAGGYDIVSLMFSNTVPNDDVSAIEILKLIYNISRDAGAKLVTISPPTKEFAPYGHIKYKSTANIAEWMNSQPVDYNIDAYALTNRKTYFQKNKLLLNKEGHELIASRWMRYLNELDSTIDANILDKKDAEKKQRGAESEIKLFKKGDKSSKLAIIQKRLKSLEYPIGDAEIKSGQFGETTEVAVKSFQLFNEMPVTGYIDENTARAILKTTARSYSSWAGMFASSMPGFIKNILGKDEPSETGNVDISSTSVQFTTGDYKTSYSDDIATQAAAILRREEGMVLTPMWDVNNWRIGHGSSTITKPDGTVVTLSNNKAVKPNITITPEDAERDLKRRLNAEFIPSTKRILGPIADKFNNGTLAALTSVCYNYGTIPNSVVQAARTGDIKQLAEAVAALGIKSPIHKGRRNREASWILGSVGETSSTISNASATPGKFGKSIAIGDSLTPNVARSAGIQAAPGLWKSGITVEGLLNNHVKQYAGKDPAVKNVVISIGTNGIYKTSSNTVTELVNQLRSKFPNAKLFVVKGTYGPAATWSKPLTTVDPKTVNTYYSYFANNGVNIIPTAIGNQKDAHAYTDIYNVIGNEIKARLS